MAVMTIKEILEAGDILVPIDGTGYEVADNLLVLTCADDDVVINKHTKVETIIINTEKTVADVFTRTTGNPYGIEETLVVLR